MEKALLLTTQNVSGAGSINIPLELMRNAESQAPPQSH